MNQGTKTGIFWVVAVVMLVFATIVAWPTRTTDPIENKAGTPLFERFTDPLVAASLRIVTFDEEQGRLANFEVRKDSETALWTIPSRDGYPADALEQMRDAANSLVGLRILDIQTSNAEDHDDLGVAEPEDLRIGDQGVGRLVTFKDASQETLASLIIGDALKDDPEKRYVRIPGQDPVYVVKLDQSPLTTRFQDWIEDDLLQLSSIDIADMEVRDYSAAIGQNEVLVTRKYDATVTMDGSQWKLARLTEYDSQDLLAQPSPTKVSGLEKLNKAKLDATKNALDDLRIVDVVRKPEGMSVSLRADQELLSDNNAVLSLAQRGFYPRPSALSGEFEIVAANGELLVTLNDGVKYVMRFGNIAGVANKEDASEKNAEDVDAGVNRYLLVTTMVDQSKFPPPELRPVPQTLEDLEAILNPQPDTPATETPPSQPQEKSDDQPADESEAAAETSRESNADETKTEKADSAEADPKQNAAQQQPAKEEVPLDERLSDEEKQERLEAEQEKITKENQRKMDARKDRLEVAQRRVRELNARFADWYYVIPEDTYAMLRIKRDELFERPAAEADAGAGVSPPAAGPTIGIPGLPGNSQN